MSRDDVVFYREGLTATVSVHEGPLASSAQVIGKRLVVDRIIPAAYDKLMGERRTLLLAVCVLTVFSLLCTQPASFLASDGSFAILEKSLSGGRRSKSGLLRSAQYHHGSFRSVLPHSRMSV